MKELNLTETQLRSWQPRQPAARLKRRIFAAAADAPATARWLWGGLAPTLACAWLALMALNHNGEGFGQSPGRTLVLGNQTAASLASAGEQTAQNHLAAVTFEWTNRSVFNSSIGFTPTTNLNN